MSDIQVGVNVGSVAPVERLTSALDLLTGAMKRLPATSNLDAVARSLEQLRGTATGTATGLESEAARLMSEVAKVQQAYTEYDKVLANRLRSSRGKLSESSKGLLAEMRTGIQAQETLIMQGATSLAAAIKTAGDVEANSVKIAEAAVATAKAEVLTKRAKAQVAEATAAARNTLPFSNLDSRSTNVAGLRNASASNISPQILLNIQTSGGSAAASATAYKEAYAAIAVVEAQRAESLDKLYARGQAQSAAALAEARRTLPFSSLASGVSNVAGLRGASASNISPQVLLGITESGGSAAASAAAYKEAYAAIAAVNAERAASLEGMYARGKAQSVAALREARKTLPFSYVGSQTNNIDALRNASASGISPQTLLGLEQSGNSAAASAAAYKEAFAAADKLAKTPILPPDAAKLPGLTSSLGKFTLAAGDAHSAARGLASGFGALWLTWGSVVPLLAGAAISNSFVQMVKMGAEAQHTFEIIRVLSGESAGSVANLNTQMLMLARTGPFGPLEVAEAMKTLSLAGLSAAEVSSSVKDVLNFAVAGTTSIKTAADVMTTVATAFKVSATGYNYVGDVISKTAAVSKASVESIGESFKAASTVNSLYGASLEDVGVGLALLSNIGVQGSAAGTSLRNMYTDIMGRTPKVTNALKVLGVEAIDPTTGKVKALADIFSQLNTGLAKFNPTSQTRLLSDVFSERGGKEAFAVLDALRAKAKETGSTAESYLAEIQLKIQNAAGFMATSSAQLALTPLNQMKSVMASLQATLVESFDGLQPYILQTAERLREAFNSAEFKSALQTMGRLIGGLTVLFAEHLNGLLLLAGGYVGLKVVGLTASLMEGLTAKVMAGTAALAANATATYTAAAAEDALTLAKARGAEVGAASQVAALSGGAKYVAMLSGVLGWVSKVLPWVTALWVAWELYSVWAGKSSVASDAMTDNKALLASLKAEADRLHEINEAVALGITLEDLKQRKKAATYRDNASQGVSAAEAELERVKNQVAPAGRALSPGLRQRNIDNAQAEVDRQKALRDESLKAMQVEQKRISVESELIKARENAAAAARQKAVPSGPGDYQKAGGIGPHMPGADANPFNNYTRLYDNQLKEIKRTYDQDVQLNDDRLKAKLISEGQHSAILARILNERETKANEVFAAERARDEAAYAKAKKEIESKPDSKYYSGADRKKQLSDLDDNYAKAKSALNEKMEATTDAVAQAERRAAVASSEHAAKLKEDFADYWRAEDVKLEKLAKEEELHKRMLTMNPAEQAAAQAGIDATSRHEEFILRLDKQYIKANADLKDLTDRLKELDQLDLPADDGELTRATKAKAQAQREVELLNNQREEARRRSVSAAAQAEGYAYTKTIDSKRREIVTSVAESISEGIFNGGKLSAKGLADYLRQQLIQKPFTIMLNGLLDSITGPGGVLGGLGSGLAKSALGIGGLSGMLGLGGSGTVGGTSANSAAILESAAANGLNGSDLMSDLRLTSLDVGTPYVPRDMIAQIHEGEAIVPAKWNNADTFGGSGTVNITQHIRIDGSTDRGQINQMLQRNKAETLRAVQENQRRGGALIR